MDLLLGAHRWLAYALLLAFALVIVVGVGLRVAGRVETPDGVRALQHWTENLLAVNVVVGLVLVVAGGRIGGPDAWQHYLYGSLFPLIAVVGGRIAALRRETRQYVSFAWGAFFALGLASRAMLIGLESTGRSIWDLV